MKKFVFSTIVSITILACEKEDEFQSHRLRVRNDTPFSLDNVYIKQGDSQHDYGPLQPDEISTYESFIIGDFFSYPYIRISTGGKDFEFDIQPTEAPPTQVNQAEKNPLTGVITVNEHANNALSIYFIE